MSCASESICSANDKIHQKLYTENKIFLRAVSFLSTYSSPFQFRIFSVFFILIHIIHIVMHILFYTFI